MVNVHALQAQRDVWARLADSRGFIGEIARKKLAHLDTTLGTNDRTPAPPPPPPTLGPQIATTKTGADALRTVPLQIVPR